MKNKTLWILSSLATLAPSFLGFLLVLTGSVPEIVPLHWGFNGKADHHGIPLILFCVIPVFLLLVHLLTLWHFSRQKKEEAGDKKAMGLLFWILPITSWGIEGVFSVLVLQIASPNVAVLVFLGALFLLLGHYMPKLSRNSVFGIRCNWTLQSDNNWKATHRFAGRLMMLAGVLFFAWLPFARLGWSWIVILSLTFVICLCPMLYSYSYYRKELAAGMIPQKAMPYLTSKKKLVSWVLLTTVLFFVLTILLVGEVEITYGKGSFTVDATFWEEMTISYQDIDSLEYLPSLERESRVTGFASLRLALGEYRVKEKGLSTLYTYTGSPSGVALYLGGRVVILSGETDVETREIYEEILKRWAPEALIPPEA